MSFLYSVIGFILAIGVLVAVHEFGHFWMARKLGVKVLTFSIGFGKPIWSKVAGADQIEYRIAQIPLGGYVKMLGEGTQADPVAQHEAHRAFDNQPIWKRTLIVAAGPGINFLFAILLFGLLGLKSTQQLIPVFGDIPQQSIIAEAGVKSGDMLISVNGKDARFLSEHDLYIFNQVLKRDPIELLVRSGSTNRSITIDTSNIPIYRINPASLMRQLGFVPIAPPDSVEIEEVSDGSPAQQAGILAGDTFVSINGQAIESWRDLSQQVAPAANQVLDIELDRNGVRYAVKVAPEAVAIGDQQVGRLGVRRVFIPYPESQLVSISRGPIDAVVHGVQQTWLMSSLTVRMLWKMVTLQVSHTNVNGPIMIADVAGKAIQVGWDTYLYLLAIISISLGVMNLLPIPMLDGGHLATYIVESVAGKNVAEKVFLAMQPLGLIMLAGLMSLAFYNDILRIFN